MFAEAGEDSKKLVQESKGGEKDIPTAKSDSKGGEKDIPTAKSDIPTAKKDSKGGEKDIPNAKSDIPNAKRDFPIVARELPNEAGGMLRRTQDTTMPTDWINQNTLALIAQIDQFITALNNLAGQAASGLTPAQFTALLALKTDLQAKYTAQLAAEAAFRGAVDSTGASQLAATNSLRLLGRAANSNTNMTDVFRNSAGLTVRDTQPTPGDLPVVLDLAVVGRPNGNNFCDWGTPAGVASGIGWEIESALGSAGPWLLVGSTSRTDFIHEDAGAGVHRLYRVIAKRGDRRGEAGNEAAVYG